METKYYQQQNTILLIYMHVFLPNFAFNEPKQIHTPFRNSKKVLNTFRANTNQGKRTTSIDIFNQLKTLNIQRQGRLVNRKNLFFYLPQSCGSTIVCNKSSREYRNSSMVSLNNEKPIHSRKSNNKNYENLYLRKKRMQNQERVKKKRSATSVSFLVTHSPFGMERAAVNNQFDHYIPMQCFNSHIKRKFPKKKVKSAFVPQQFRPWSPKKGQIQQFNP